MKKIIKEKVLVNKKKIKDIIVDIGKLKNIENREAAITEIENIEKKCYKLIVKKTIVRWYQRLREKKFKEYKIKKKEIILKIK